MSAPHHLLWDALVLPLPHAEEAWRQWRACTNLNHLDSASFHLLPTLAGRMAPWLADDPEQEIVLGICRRAWSQNQLRRKLLANALAILGAAGIERAAAIGPVLFSAQWPEGSIRPVGRVDLLVEPASVRAAFDAFLTAGWKPLCTLLDTTTDQFSFAPGIELQSPGGGKLHIHWRALPNTDLALRPPDSVPLQPMQPGPLAPYSIPAEHSLVVALGGQLQDEVDWRFDALTICRRGGLDGELLAALLRRRSAARTRLDELRREWGAKIPEEVTRRSPTSGLEQILASALRIYRRRTARRS